VAATDSDGDGLPNRWEREKSLTRPYRADTDRDGIPDGKENLDSDLLTKRQVYRAGTHPRKADTDGDGYRDGAEVSAATDPLDALSHPESPPPPPDPGSAPTVPGAPGCPIFPTSNVWNRRVDGLPVAADSATLIGTIGLDRSLHMDFGSYAGYGIPFQVVDADTPRSTVLFDHDDESDHVGYPIPASPLVEGGSDAHILLVERDECRLYELFAARRVDGTWLAGSGATWDLDSNQLRPDGWTSADAAGLPILPGLVRYDEVAAGVIAHALRFTTNQTRRAYIYPARHYASASTSSALPPMGLRVRLEATYDTSGFSPQARVIAETLKRYGMILADNGSPWYISGMSDPRFDDRCCTSSTPSPGATSRSSTQRARQRAIAQQGAPAGTLSSRLDESGRNSYHHGMKAIVSEKGQVTIPKRLRDRLGIRPGQVLDFEEDQGRLVARKTATRDQVDAVYGMLRGIGRTDDLIREMRGGDPDAVDPA
jgi:AbrB family looped-hinge helix DNA binding protein